MAPFPSLMLEPIQELEFLALQGFGGIEIRWTSFCALGYLEDGSMQELAKTLKKAHLRVVSWSCPSDPEVMNRASYAADTLRVFTASAGTVFICVDPPDGYDWRIDRLQEVSAVGEQWSVTLCPRLPQGGSREHLHDLLQNLDALHSHYLGLCFDPARLIGCGVVDLGTAWIGMARHVRLCRASRGPVEGQEINYPAVKELLFQAPGCDGIVVEEVERSAAFGAFLDHLFRLWPQGDEGRQEPKVSLFPSSYVRSPRPRRKKKLF